MRTFTYTFIIVLLFYFTPSGFSVTLPELLYPIPEVQTIQKYDNYPVGYSSGIPDITIPLYEIVSGKFKLPISMKINPSGRKPEDREGILGYGWTLDVGYAVSRMQRGLKDENKKYQFLPSSLINDECYIYTEESEIIKYDEYSSNILKGIADVQDQRYGKDVTFTFYDSQYDIFRLNLPSGSVQFILKDSMIGGVQTKIPFTIPYKPVKIEILYGKCTPEEVETGDVIPNSTNFQFDCIINFIITDVDGVQYYFGRNLDQTKFCVENSSTFTSENEMDVWRPYGEQLNININAWNITAIISSDKSDTISFEYGERKKYIFSNAIKQLGIYSSATFSMNDLYIKGGYNNYEQAADYSNFSAVMKSDFDSNSDGAVVSSGSNYYTSRMKKISFNQGSIVFDVDTNDKMLRTLKVQDHVSNIIKTFDFVYSKHSNEILFTLDTLKINSIQKYAFAYYRPDSPLGEIKFAKDWWGYYNGEKSNGTLIPNFDIQLRKGNNQIETRNVMEIFPLAGRQPANRSVNEEACKIGMLKSITYPTGGNTEFIYESNKYQYVDQNFYNGPGLRIRQIINQSVLGLPEYKTYFYSDPDFYDSNNFPIELHPIEANFVTDKRVRSLFLGNITMYNGPLGSPFTEEGAIGGMYSWGAGNPGSCVDVLFMDYRMRNYSSDFTLEYSDLSSRHVFYQKVTEYYGISNTDNQGAVVYEYNPLNRKVLKYLYNDLQTMSDQSILHEGKYAIDYKIKYISDEFCWKGGKLIKKTEFENKNGNLNIIRQTVYSYSDYVKDQCRELNAHRYFTFNDAGKALEYSTLKSEIEDYETNIVQNKAYCYANKKYTSGIELLSREYTKDYTANGTTESVKLYEYEPDFLQLKKVTTFDSGAVYDEENQNTTGSNKVVEYKYPHQNSGTPYNLMVNRNIISPIVETTEYKNNNQFIERERTNYYQWSNNLIAPQTVQYWHNTQNNPETRLMYHHYNLHGNPTYISKDDAEKVIYIWGYKNQYPIAQILGVSYSEFIGKINESTLNTIANKNVPSTSDIAMINGLRTQLPNAQITTYTFKPLVGISSKTDSRGLTTYYEYDASGWLVRSYFKENGSERTVKTYDYNFKNP